MNLLQNLKGIVINFKFLPKKALLDSYGAAENNSTSIVMFIILAVLSGIGNVFFNNYLVSKAFAILSNLENSIIGGSNSYGVTYTKASPKYFIIGVVAFFIVYIICTLVTYAVKTNVFKNPEDFIKVAKITLVSLIPATILIFVANVLINLSIMAYLIFMIISVIAFAVYYYQHIRNVSPNLRDGICFACSVSFVIVMIILVKLDMSTFKMNLF